MLNMIKNKVYKIFALIIGILSLIAFIFGIAKIGYYTSIRELYNEDYFLIQGYCTTFVLNILTCILLLFYNKNKTIKIIFLIINVLNIVVNCFTCKYFISEAVRILQYSNSFVNRFTCIFECSIYLIITLLLFALFLYLIIEIIRNHRKRPVKP